MKDREGRNKNVISNERDDNGTCNACGWMNNK